MSLKFRLRGLAETFVEGICCPKCDADSGQDDGFSTEFTKVTFEGIVVVAHCHNCDEVFVPNGQKLGVLDPRALRDAVKRDSMETGEGMLVNYDSVCFTIERMNAVRRGAVH